jgi:hypothetical protein
MTPDGGLSQKAIEVLLEPVADILKQILGPAAEETGALIGTELRMLRYKRALRLFQRVREYSRTAGIEVAAVKPKLLLPILNNATIEEDDDLQDRWAALLMNASGVTGDNLVLPSYVEILRQLTRNEAVLLDSIFDKVTAALAEHYPNYPITGNWAYLVDLGRWPVILHLYSDLGLSRHSASVLLNYKKNRLRMTAEMVEDYTRFRLSFETLLRLELLKEIEPADGPEGFHLRLTTVGFEFVRACRPLPIGTVGKGLPSSQ